MQPSGSYTWQTGPIVKQKTSLLKVLFLATIALVNFLNGWTLGSASRCSSTRAASTRKSPGKSTGTTRHAPTCTLVQLGDDWHADFFQILLFVFKFIFLRQLKNTSAHDGYSH